jgi:signal transduction histidine kinase
LGVPVWEKGNVLGVVCTQVDIKKVNKFVGNYTGLGETGETVLATQKGNLVEIIAPLRHDPNAAFKNKIRIGSHDALPIQLAVQARKGVGPSIDYRGKNIMAVWKYLTYPGWGMVVKVDASEVFAPIQEYKDWMIIIGLIVIVCVALMSVFVARSISNPVVELMQATKRIASGDLTSKIDIKSRDEIGRLASSFNAMVHSLKQRTTELEISNKELEAFSYSVSHDLRAPLRGMDGFSKLLLQEYADELDEHGKDYLQRVRKASQKMARLIDDLLALSRLSRQEMTYASVNLSRLAGSITKELKETEPERQVDFDIQEGVVAYGDADLLSIVIDNLLQNAWKFTGKKPSAKIELGVTHVSGEAAYFVRDDGVGFDMTYVGKLFGAFQRLHSEKEYHGTGIGLATVKRMINRHGGRVWAEGEVDKGATFYFTIPKYEKQLKNCRHAGSGI